MEKASFEELGGRPILQAISKTFYDKVYNHHWLGNYFHTVPREHIEGQQVDFMQQALRGPKRYCGRPPLSAHMHINITEELFALRENLLLESMKENKASAELISRWQMIEAAFKKSIVKNTLQDCKKRYHNDAILDFSPFVC